jgi:hypothetical protein
MTETFTLRTTIKLTHTKPKETQAMNSTVHNITIIYYSETSEERKRVDNGKHNPLPKFHILNRHN